MKFFADDTNDLEEEQINLSISGPSKPSPKSKNEGRVNNIALENSLKQFQINNNNSAQNYKGENSNKLKNKSNRKHKAKTNTNTNTNVKQLLSERLKMYNNAEKNARKAGETRKARHLNRDVQLLNALIVHYNSGNIIDPDNIPPEIKITSDLKPQNAQLGVTFKESAEIALIPSVPDLNSDSDSEMELESVLSILRLRRDQYRTAVVQNKTSGNIPRALEQLSIVKMFESVIRHLEMGEKVDLNELPGPPDCPICHINSNEKPRENEQPIIVQSVSESSFEDQIISRSTIFQALQDRLRVYDISCVKAKKESTDNIGEALRVERIIKVYKDAIKLHRAGRSFPIEELPSPPGFPPLLYLKTSTISGKRPTKIPNSSK